MSTIDFNKILECAAGFKRPLAKGSLLAKSSTHFFGYRRLRPKINSNDMHFITSCLTHKLKAKPHTVEVMKIVRDSDVEIRGTCTCKANSNRCKHIVGFMLKLERMLLSDIPIVSQTEVAKRWGEAFFTKKRLEAQKPCRFFDLCHVGQKTSKYKPLPNDLPDDLKNDIINNLVQAFSNSIFSKSINALNRPVVHRHPDPLSLSLILDCALKESSVLQINPDALLALYTNCQEEEICFFHDVVDVSKEEAERICLWTKYQNTEFWKAHRQLRITGRPSYSYYTYFSNKCPNWRKKLKSILSSTQKMTADMMFGKMKEGPTKVMYSNKNKVQILANVGMIINPYIPWLAYSPDGFAIENGVLTLLEVKCLKVGKTYTGLEFLKQVPFLRVDENNKVEMRQRHEYYGQIQLGLAICNVTKAKLLLYVHKDKTVEVDVHINIPFVNNYVHTLTEVYFREYLPFLCANKKDLKINSATP